MPLKLDIETVEYIRSQFSEVLLSEGFKISSGIGNSLVFERQETFLKGLPSVKMEVSVRWTEENAKKDLVEVYLKSVSSNRIYMSRLNFDVLLEIKPRLRSLINKYHDYTVKYFLMIFFKEVQNSRKSDTGDYQGNEKNPQLLRLKEIDRIDTSIYSVDDIIPPLVFFVDNDTPLSFDDKKFFMKLNK